MKADMDDEDDLDDALQCGDINLYQYMAYKAMLPSRGVRMGRRRNRRFGRRRSPFINPRMYGGMGSMGGLYDTGLSGLGLGGSSGMGAGAMGNMGGLANYLICLKMAGLI